MNHRVSPLAWPLLFYLVLLAQLLWAQQRLGQLITLPAYPPSQPVLVPVPAAALQACRRYFPAVANDSLATWAVGDTTDAPADQLVEVRFQRVFSDNRWRAPVQYEGSISFRGNGQVNEYTL